MTGEVESLDLRSSRALIFFNISDGNGPVLNRCRPDGMWCDAALRMMARKIFSLFGNWSIVVFCSTCLLSLYCIGPSLPFFLLQIDDGTMLYRIENGIHVQTNVDW